MNQAGAGVNYLCRRGLAAWVAATGVALLAAAAGCNREFLSFGGSPEKVPRMIGAVANPFGLEPMEVLGYGIVGGLQGSGRQHSARPRPHARVEHAQATGSRQAAGVPRRQGRRRRARAGEDPARLPPGGHLRRRRAMPRRGPPDDQPARRHSADVHAPRRRGRDAALPLLPKRIAELPLGSEWAAATGPVVVAWAPGPKAAAAASWAAARPRRSGSSR